MMRKQSWGSLRQDTRYQAWERESKLANLFKCYDCFTVFRSSLDEDTCPNCDSEDTFRLGNIRYRNWRDWPNR